MHLSQGTRDRRRAEGEPRGARRAGLLFRSRLFRGKKLRWSDAAFADFRHHLRELTGRSWGVSMDYRHQRLAQYVRRWMGYFAISDYYRPNPELDRWLRRRIRMCYWK